MRMQGASSALCSFFLAFVLLLVGQAAAQGQGGGLGLGGGGADVATPDISGVPAFTITTLPPEEVPSGTIMAASDFFASISREAAAVKETHEDANGASTQSVTASVGFVVLLGIGYLLA